MRLNSELVQAVERAVRDEAGLTRIFHYGLYREETPARSSFHYIKCHMEVWRGQQLASEDVDIAGGLGVNDVLARSVFARLVEAADPVCPIHLAEVVHDQVIEFDPRWLNEEASLASRDSA